MKTLSYTEWLIRWFGTRNSEENEPCDLSENYFETGRIDSMGIMDLILDVERQFGIKFNEKHFQDRRFATIQGLSELIHGLCQEKEKRNS